MKKIKKIISARDVKYVQNLEGVEVVSNYGNVFEIQYPQLSAEDADIAYIAAMQYMAEVAGRDLKHSCEYTESSILDATYNGSSDFTFEPIDGDEMIIPTKEDIQEILENNLKLGDELDRHQFYEPGTGEFFEELNSSIPGGVLSFDFEEFEEECYRILGNAVMKYCEHEVGEDVEDFSVYYDFDSSEIQGTMVDYHAMAEDYYYEQRKEARINERWGWD